MLNVTFMRRAGLVLAASIGGAVVMSFSLAMAAADNSPQVASLLAPYLGEPKAELAQALLPAAMQGGDAKAVRALGRQAALLDPLDPSPIRTLGYAERAKGRDDQANALFSYANTLTRRDLAVNLDFVMEAAKRGDAEAMIRHFSIALRTSRRSWDRLFPVIYQATASEEITAPLVRVLATDPQWKWAFLDGLVRQGPNPLVISRLFQELEALTPIENEEIERSLIARLIEGGHYAEAQARHRALLAKKGNGSLANGDFEREPLGTPFEWANLGGTALETSVSDNVTSKELGRSLYFRIPAGADSELLRLTAVLRPGQQELVALLGKPLQGQVGDIVLEAECLGSGAIADRVVLSRPTAARLRIPFSVPADCSAARLYLKVRAPGPDAAWASWIDNLELTGAAA